MEIEFETDESCLVIVNYLLPLIIVKHALEWGFFFINWNGGRKKRTDLFKQTCKDRKKS